MYGKRFVQQSLAVEWDEMPTNLKMPPVSKNFQSFCLFPERLEDIQVQLGRQCEDVGLLLQAYVLSVPVCGGQFSMQHNNYYNYSVFLPSLCYEIHNEKYDDKLDVKKPLLYIPIYCLILLQHKVTVTCLLFSLFPLKTRQTRKWDSSQKINKQCTQRIHNVYNSRQVSRH